MLTNEKIGYNSASKIVDRETNKIDVLKTLADRGYTANRMRREKILSEATMQNLRQGGNINTKTLNTICIILRCQPSDIIEIIPTDEEKIKYF